MSWKIVKNKSLKFSDNKYLGICPICKKEATITIRETQRKICKTDLQNTHIEIGRSCSLLKKEWKPCLDNCTLTIKNQ